MNGAFGERIEDWVELYVAHCWGGRSLQEKVSLEEVYISLNAQYTGHCPFPNDAKLRDAVRNVLEQDVDNAVLIDYQKGHNTYVFSKDSEGKYFYRGATLLDKVTHFPVILNLEFCRTVENVKKFFRSTIR